MGERAAHRAAVADLEVADVRRRPRQQRDRSSHLGVVLDARFGGGRTDPQGAVSMFDALQLADPSDIDEMVDVREPQREHRHEALPAGEHLGLLAELGEELDGLVSGRRSVVVERRPASRLIAQMYIPPLTPMTWPVM